MLKVREIMTAGIFSLEEGAAADEAAWGLTWRKMGGAPVRDPDGNLVGVLSKSDLVDPQPAQWIKGEATVGDLMNPAVRTVYAEDPAMAAVMEMAKDKIHRVIVLDDEGKPVGIVTAFDVVRALAGGAKFDLDEPAAQRGTATAL